MKPVMPRILYLWERWGLKRIELFTQEDLAKKPELHRDTEKLPDIPLQGRFAAAHQRQLDLRNKRKR